jgi:fructokinase
MNSQASPNLAFGELLWDVLHRESTQYVLGGAPSNFAFRLSSLGYSTLPVSRVGEDPLGQRALQQLQAAGVDTRLIQRDLGFATGTVDVFFKGGGHDFTIHPGVAYDHISLTEPLRIAAQETRLICFGSLIQRNEISRKTLEAVLALAPEAEKIVDINLRKNCYSLESVRWSIEHGTILKLNDEEALEISAMMQSQATEVPAIASELMERFPNLSACIVTRGPHGAYAISRNNERVDVPGHKVAVADTIGSGDSFTAGFAAKRLEQASFEECVRFGNALGALVATKPGGMCVVSHEEIEQLLLGERTLGFGALPQPELRPPPGLQP